MVVVAAISIVSVVGGGSVDEETLESPFTHHGSDFSTDCVKAVKGE